MPVLFLNVWLERKIRRFPKDSYIQMSKRKRKRQPRNCSVLSMILTRKGGYMKDRREDRKGDKNLQREYLEEARDQIVADVLECIIAVTSGRMG